jgi:hypothetical protein
MEQSELDILLSIHRLTFNWGDPSLKWWLVGQEKGSNTLKRTVPQHAPNIEAAKIAATQFIKEKFQ